jgi:hypothetical protein
MTERDAGRRWGSRAANYVATRLYDAPVRLADGMAQRTLDGNRRSDQVRVADSGGRCVRQGKRLGQAPMIVDKEVVQAIRARAFVVAPTIEAFDGCSVFPVDGRRLEHDGVICPIDCQRGLESMVGHLGVHHERGLPRSTGETLAARGLRFIGFLSRPGLIAFVTKQSKRLAERRARRRRTGTDAVAVRLSRGSHNHEHDGFNLGPVVSQEVELSRQRGVGPRARRRMTAYRPVTAQGASRIRPRGSLNLDQVTWR